MKIYKIILSLFVTAVACFGMVGCGDSYAVNQLSVDDSTDVTTELDETLELILDENGEGSLTILQYTYYVPGETLLEAGYFYITPASNDTSYYIRFKLDIVYANSMDTSPIQMNISDSNNIYDNYLIDGWCYYADNDGALLQSNSTMTVDYESLFTGFELDYANQGNQLSIVVTAEAIIADNTDIISIAEWSI